MAALDWSGMMRAAAKASREAPSGEQILVIGEHRVRVAITPSLVSDAVHVTVAVELSQDDYRWRSAKMPGSIACVPERAAAFIREQAELAVQEARPAEREMARLRGEIAAAHEQLATPRVVADRGPNDEYRFTIDGVEVAVHATRARSAARVEFTCATGYGERYRKVVDEEDVACVVGGVESIAREAAVEARAEWARAVAGLPRENEPAEQPTMLGLDAWTPDPVWSAPRTDSEAREQLLSAIKECSSRPHAIVPTLVTQAQWNEMREVIEDERSVASNAACLRCGAPAYLGLDRIACLRSGGCKTAEERIGEPTTALVVGRREKWWLAEDPGYPHTCFVRDADVPRGEVPAVTTEYIERRRGEGVICVEHPTREGAVALWRAVALEQERRAEECRARHVRDGALQRPACTEEA